MTRLLILLALLPACASQNRIDYPLFEQRARIKCTRQLYKLGYGQAMYKSGCLTTECLDRWGQEEIDKCVKREMERLK